MDFADMKPVSINAILAEFLGQTVAAKPPLGYLTIQQFGDKIGKSYTRANGLLLRALKAGKVKRVRVGRFDYYGPFADA